MWQLIKKHIPEYIKGSILSMLQPKNSREFVQYSGKKKIVISLAGFYQNLGDMALTYSQAEFLKNNFPEYDVIILSSHDTYLKTKALKAICSEDDIITIIGGGNMDDMYISLEDTRRFIIKSFPRNKIISFPQTISFSDTKFGRKRLKKSIRTYSRHKDLVLFAREEKSYEFMKKSFPKNRVYIAPDIVLSIDKREPKFERNGALVCFRSDKEKAMSDKYRNNIMTCLERQFKNIEITDTINVSIDECSRENYIETLHIFWNKLKTKEIVITDRLHCMIFCAITDTPCIVFPSINQKIEGIYNMWLKGNSNIALIKSNEINSFNDILLRMVDTEFEQFIDLNDKYDSLLKSIRGYFDNEK